MKTIVAIRTFALSLSVLAFAPALALADVCRLSAEAELQLAAAPSGEPNAAGSICKIAGNIDNFGRKIYVLPDSPWYGHVQIDPDRGERWFCSEDEAIAAGWADIDTAKAPVALPTVNYSCPGFGSITVVWDADMAMLTIDGQRRLLPRQESASGARYGDAGHEIWEHQGVLRFKDDKGGQFDCTADANPPTKPDQ